MLRETTLEIPAIPGAPSGLAEALAWASGALLLIGVPLFMAELFGLARARRLDRRRLLGLLTSGFCLIPATGIELALGGQLVEGMARLGSLAPWSIPNTWATTLACLLLADFTYYWEHRAAHRIHLLWAAYHSVHHSGSHYDQSIGLRVSFIDLFFTPLFYVPLVVLGFHPLLVLACLVLVLAWQQWIHTETVGPRAWLDRWLNTPSNHRVHHGRNPAYLDRNYGGILIIWDRLFGTYAAEHEPVDYGLVEPLERQDPLSVHFHGLAKLGRRLRGSKGLGETARVLLGPPEWSELRPQRRRADSRPDRPGPTNAEQLDLVDHDQLEHVVGATATGDSFVIDDPSSNRRPMDEFAVERGRTREQFGVGLPNGLPTDGLGLGLPEHEQLSLGVEGRDKGLDVAGVVGLELGLDGGFGAKVEHRSAVGRGRGRDRGWLG